MTVALTAADRSDLRDQIARARLAREAEDRTARRNEPIVKERRPDQHNLKIIAKLERENRELRNQLEIERRKAAGPKERPQRERELRSEVGRLRAQIADIEGREAWCKTVLARNEILARKLREMGA